MNKGGFSWKRLTGVTGGCLVVVAALITSALAVTGSSVTVVALAWQGAPSAVMHTPSRLPTTTLLAFEFGSNGPATSGAAGRDISGT